MSVFLDLADAQTDSVDFKAVCCEVKLFIFVVNQQFLEKSACVDKLRSALQQRHHSVKLPELLFVLYPLDMLPEERENHLKEVKELIREVTQSIDLWQLNASVFQLVDSYLGLDGSVPYPSSDEQHAQLQISELEPVRVQMAATSSAEIR